MDRSPVWHEVGVSATRIERFGGVLPRRGARQGAHGRRRVRRDARKRSGEVLNAAACPCLG